MAIRARLTTKKKAAKRARPKLSGASQLKAGGNGLKAFSLHAFSDGGSAVVSRLRDERASHPMFALGTTAHVEQLDAETVAKRYLQQALQSKSVPSLTAPKSGDTVSEFKSLGSETIPLTSTKTVKFRQTFNGIPVYGSLVTVELDDENNLVSINSSLGEPRDVNPVAKISPSEAIKAVKDYPGFKKNLQDLVPHLSYYYDNASAKWRLVFFLEDVPVSLERKATHGTKPAPLYMDYVVDALTGKVVTELPRTPSLASEVIKASDGKNVTREIRVEVNGKTKLLKDTTLNVQTFDFKLDDPSANEKRLPGAVIKLPPKLVASAVSAHANAAAVAEFLRGVLSRNNIDNKGGSMNSSINCVVKEESDDGKQWFNAYWNGSQMVYGQRLNGKTFLSLSIDLDVVGHEMFHGVTDYTARLEYANQSGAMNESYSDIFGIIIANFSNPNTLTWNWLVGEGLSPDGKPFRDMEHPPRFDQPDNMKDYQKLPNTQRGDWGGVHTNSGIHNKAAFNILTAVDKAKKLIFEPKEVAAMFYLALTQQLSRTSQFSDSRRGVLTSAQSLFRNRPQQEQKTKLDAIAKGFSAVGIT